MTHEEPTAETSQIKNESRRPGRIRNPSSELVALMRTPSALKADKAAAQRLADADKVTDAPDRSIDDLGSARGMMAGMALGGGLWVVLIVVGVLGFAAVRRHLF